MMKLTPERVDAPAGTIITFTCSYHSSEKMQIEFQETFSGVENNEQTPQFWNDIGVLQRHEWGDERLWTVEIRPQHKMVSCVVRIPDGTVVGTLSSMIHPGGTDPSLLI